MDELKPPGDEPGGFFVEGRKKEFSPQRHEGPEGVSREAAKTRNSDFLAPEVPFAVGLALCAKDVFA